jgi:hypothetical protein
LGFILNFFFFDFFDDAVKAVLAGAATVRLARKHAQQRIPQTTYSRRPDVVLTACRAMIGFSRHTLDFWGHSPMRLSD